MAVKAGDRYQQNLFPPSIEDYVGKDDPVRAYDAIIDALPIDELGLKDRKSEVGNPNYNPKTMLKILVYAYSYGWQSGRKIERALLHNLSFIWLAGGLKPNYRTIVRFRKDNKTALKEVLKQCARLCIKLDLIEGNVLFLDGSKFRGNASINKIYTRKGSIKRLDELDKRIDNLLAEIEKIDDQEEGPGFAKLKEELQNKKTLRKKVKSILAEMDNFEYDKDKDQFRCPEGHIVRYSYYSTTKNHYVYRMQTPSVCIKCINWGVCTKNKKGRSVIRLKNEKCQKHLQSLYESDYGQKIYNKRKAKVELQFGHIKRNLKGGAFLVRGLKSVQGEMSIYASCFNIARMITLLGGVEQMVKLLSG